MRLPISQALDCGPILHRFWNTATNWLKTAYFATPLSFAAIAAYATFGISHCS